MPLAVGSTVAVLAVIGLVIGLIVLLVVIVLLHGTLAPLRKILADVKGALTAPMLERGVPGTDQLGQTRRLAESVPELALAYLQKLSLGGSPAPPAAATEAPTGYRGPTPAGYTGPTPAGYTGPAPAAPAAPAAATEAQPGEPEPPAWQRYRSS